LYEAIVPSGFRSGDCDVNLAWVMYWLTFRSWPLISTNSS